MNRRFILILLSFVFSICTYAYTPQSVPNPKNAFSDSFVSNPDGIINSEAEQQINTIASQLRSEVDVELAVVAINGMDGYDIETFANELFNHWGIGGADKNQGVLLLLDVDERVVRFEIGGGCEGLLPDALCSEIIEYTMYPYLSQNKYGEGLLAGVEEIYATLTTDEAKAELLLNYKRKNTTWVDIIVIYLILGFIVLLLVDLLAAYSIVRKPNSPNNERYKFANTVNYLLFLPTLLFPLHLYYFAKKYANVPIQIRNKPLKCPHCGHEMQKLSEMQEDKYLSVAQQREEQIRSVNYDVWLCPDCGEHVELPYVNKASSYKTCPVCGVRSYAQQSDKILVRATTRHAGEGVRTYSCRSCGHVVQKRYVIPMIVVSSGSGRGGGLGSSGGGSWGGGHSFGGGATGRF